MSVTFVSDGLEWWVAAPERRLVVSVPVECLATVDAATRRVVGVTFLPRESDAGYFGSGSVLVDSTVDGEPTAEVTDADRDAVTEAMRSDWAPLYELPESITWEG